MSDYIYTTDGELYHYGVPGMKWGRRKARGHAGPGRYLTRKGGLFAPPNKSNPKGPYTDERPEKSQRQKQYEDDRGINPHRPNGTKPRGREYGDIAVKKLSKKHPKVAKGIEVVRRIFDTANRPTY